MSKAMSWLLCALALVLGTAGHDHHHHAKDACEAEQNRAWSYGGRNGPKYWSGFCNGTNQSPININCEDVETNEDLTPLTFTNYDQPLTEAIITNNGHTVQMSPSDGITRTIKDGMLSNEYTYRQLHFHWGSVKGSRGSEHHIDGYAFPMEMHLVHTNPEGDIAVVACMFQVSWYDNSDMEPIVKALKDIKYKDESTTLNSALDMTSILPVNTSYWRYDGSLTTPDCNEGVIWTVFKNPVYIGFKQLMSFRNLWATKRSDPQDHRCHLVNNYRPLQNLNGRTVFSSV